jgi:hypothetical protein
VLEVDEVQAFVERGYLRLEGAIDGDTTAVCRALVHDQLEVPAGPPWPGPVVRGLALGPAIEAAASSHPLVDAVGALLDGEDWEVRTNLGLFVVRFPSETDPGDTGWHIDGSFPGPSTDDLSSWYVNSRSRDRGLLLLVLLTDVGPDDAPTRILVGSHRTMPALLEPFGDEGLPGLFAPLPEPEGEIALATGHAGDVYLCHPFLVHAASWPHRGVGPRIIAQPPIAIRGPLRLDVSADRLSPVARALR